MIRSRKVLISAAVAALALLVPACSAQFPDQAPQGSAQVWRSDGYGWIYSLRGGRLEIYETTEISCLPGGRLDQIGQPGPDGTVQFGRSGVASQTIRPGDQGMASLHLIGTAADVDLLPIPALPDACSRKTPDDPLTTFDIFWTTFAEHYNAFPRRNIDWAAVRDTYRPMVNSGTGPEQLFDILRRMIKPLGDAHTGINGSEDDQSFSGLRPGTRDLDERAAIARVDDHLRAAGAFRFQSFADEKIVYADLPDGRGYLRVTAFDGYNEDDGSYQASSVELTRALDTVFTAPRVAALRSLIIDVRLNSGGDDALALQIAARLTDRPYVAYTKQPRNDPREPSRYGRPQPVTVIPADAPCYTGPVNVLISDLTISAGETFVEAMMGRTPAAARIGTTTQGVFADTLSRRLPNGWSFYLGNERYLGPDQQDYEVTGIPPTVETPVFTGDGLAGDRDPALDAAR